MLVYGDRVRHVDTKGALAALDAAAAALAAAPPGLARHASAVSALIDAGGLAQGLADAAMDRTGVDAYDPASDMAMRVTRGFADAVAQSWRTGFRSAAPPPTRALAELAEFAIPASIQVKACEGYSFYAVYPELYVEAGLRTFSGPPPRVIGLRSIGASLSAAAAAGIGAATPICVRPVGHPFARELRLAPALVDRLTAPSEGGYAVVDEGPGLSGSSFAAVGDLLHRAGVAPDSIVYLPSHGGADCPQATPERRARWAAARRAWVDFESAIEPRLLEWAEPLTGKAHAPLTPLSGGAWRNGRADAPPAWPEQERRKYRLLAEKGAFLLKFGGLGRAGEAALARAQRLHAAGFTSEPLGLAHGFLVERWVEGEPFDPASMPREAWLTHLARYLGFRARALPAERADGASLAELHTMIRRNLGLSGLDAVAEGVTVPAAAARPIAVDGRLHRWEWLRTPEGRLIKTDAVDHCAAHDLIGCQDVAWDIAGAAVEFRLTAAETKQLRTAVAAEAQRPVDRALVSFMTLAYLAFQIGYWRMAAGGCEGSRAADHAKTYEDLCARLRMSQ